MIERMSFDAAFFRELETRLHHRDVRNSPEKVAELLADDFVEFGCSGRVYNKAQVIAALSTDESEAPNVHDFAIKTLTPDVLLVTYRSGRGDQFAWRSSIWRRGDGKWCLTFHQATAGA
jgi:hypothetical protein